jgi:hypothetical protein
MINSAGRRRPLFRRLSRLRDIADVGKLSYWSTRTSTMEPT